MNPVTDDCSVFNDRFVTRAQAERYRDRYRTGRRVRIDRLERAALRRLLQGIDRVSVAMDIPSGTGRLTPLLGEVADRVILADGSRTMLELAREDLPDLKADYLETDAQNIALESESVDLAFCHRFLHHIHEKGARALVFRELARVSRRYVVISYYTPGFRDRWRWLQSCVTPGAQHRDRPVTRRRFFVEAARAGLRPQKTQVLRRFPLTALFCLFERMPG